MLAQKLCIFPHAAPACAETLEQSVEVIVSTDLAVLHKNERLKFGWLDSVKT